MWSYPDYICAWAVRRTQFDWQAETSSFFSLVQFLIFLSPIPKKIFTHTQTSMHMYTQQAITHSCISFIPTIARPLLSYVFLIVCTLCLFRFIHSNTSNVESSSSSTHYFTTDEQSLARSLNHSVCIPIHLVPCYVTHQCVNVCHEVYFGLFGYRIVCIQT